MCDSVTMSSGTILYRYLHNNTTFPTLIISDLRKRIVVSLPKITCRRWCVKLSTHRVTYIIHKFSSLYSYKVVIHFPVPSLLELLRILCCVYITYCYYDFYFSGYIYYHNIIYTPKL